MKIALEPNSKLATCYKTIDGINNQQVKDSTTSIVETFEFDPDSSSGKNIYCSIL